MAPRPRQRRRLAALAAHCRHQSTAATTEALDAATPPPVAQVPTLDLGEVIAAASLDSLAADLPVVAQIRDACATWGFFQVVNHGVAPEQLAAFEAAMTGFFAQPRGVKEAVRRTETNSKGWYDDELTKQRVDWKEGYDVGAQDGSLDRRGLDGYNVWPAVAGFEGTIRAYFAQMEELAARLTGCMALGLGMAPTYFAREFEGCHSSYLRLNHYPPCPELPGGAETSRPDASVWDDSSGEVDPWSISHHTDAGAVTVLHQTQVQSLQVLQPRDGRWYDVEPQPGAFVINTGDIMQVWSNDRYVAPVHRVKAQRSLRRYSAPFFYNPSYETSYAPVSGTVSDQEPARYRPINWGEFRLGRFQGDFADVGAADVQIADFRIEEA
jgi:isopenicillin N synthase-like dioxygenase